MRNGMEKKMKIIENKMERKKAEKKMEEKTNLI